MSGDYTRFTDAARKRFSGVLQQQGRVQLDSDWNEQVEITKRRDRMLALDILGPVGWTPPGIQTGFLLQYTATTSDFTINSGRVYVDGLVVECFDEDKASYLSQPFVMTPSPAPALPASGIFYLDVWEREVTYVEDPQLLDVALGGVDTATRTQTIWQLKIQPAGPTVGGTVSATCGGFVPPAASGGQLTTTAISPPKPDDPCILPPLAGYRGLENRLYRLEIHKGGAMGTAKWKWSRDNGSIVSAVTGFSTGSPTRLTVNRIGRDPVLRFRISDWVMVTDDHRELMGEPGEMARITDIDEANLQIALDRAIPATSTRLFATGTDITARHTRVQRWDQAATTNTLDGDGLITTGTATVDLEDGIQIKLGLATGGEFKTGDYWMFAARVADASVEQLTNAPPRGIVHHYVQLAAFAPSGSSTAVLNCRPPVLEDKSCCCCVVTVPSDSNRRLGELDLPGAIAVLPILAPDEKTPVIICLREGDHFLAPTIIVKRPNVTIRGCGCGTRLIARSHRTEAYESASTQPPKSPGIEDPASGIAIGATQQPGGISGVAGGPLLVMAGDGQVVEDLAILGNDQWPLIVLLTSAGQRVERCCLESSADHTTARGSEPVLSAWAAQDLLICSNRIVGPGGIEVSGTYIRIVENRILGGPVHIFNALSIDSSKLQSRLAMPTSPGAQTKRIRFQLVQRETRRVEVLRNEIIASSSHGVILGNDDEPSVVDDIHIVENLISAAAGAGIASGYFDPQDDGEEGLVDGLLVVGNEILDCVTVKKDTRTNSKSLITVVTLATAGKVPLGGVILARVYDLNVRDNRIEHNGTHEEWPICGIFARYSRGVEISRNVICKNGVLSRGKKLTGPQAGISLRNASVSMSTNPDPEDDRRQFIMSAILPAARIADNFVDQTRGPALYIAGVGPMTIDGNRFQAVDILGDLSDETNFTIDQFIGTVFIANFAWPAWLGAAIAGSGFAQLSKSDPQSLIQNAGFIAVTAGGQTLFRGNQCVLNLSLAVSEIALANVAIISLDDTDISGNQTQGVLGAFSVQAAAQTGPVAQATFKPDILLADLLNLALTTRQTHNGLMSTPFLTIYSIISRGYFNHCIGNQSTSCISAIGQSPKSVVRDNAVLFPNPSYCPE